MSRSADFLYMPALHQGYVNYLEKREGFIGILDEGLVRETPRLERDIRALSSGLMVSVVQVVAPNRDVVLVTADNLTEIRDGLDKAYLPDEDVSHVFAETHLGGLSVTFEKTFLRWDKQISTAETMVVTNMVISTDELHRSMMMNAGEEALKSPDWWRQVGAVISKEGESLLVGHNHPYPTTHNVLETFGDPRSNFDAGERIDLQRNIHAEAGLIARAAREGTSLEGTDIYVTTFPCPNCAKLIAEAGIKRVFYEKGYSLLDAEDILNAKDVEIILVQDKG